MTKAKTNTTPKLTGPQITALKLKFRQLLKEGAKQQYDHYYLQQKLNEKKADENVAAIHAVYAPAIKAITDKIDALWSKRRALEQKRDAQVCAEREKLFGPKPMDYYNSDRQFDRYWADLNLRLQFIATPDADSMVKLLSDEVTKILNDKG